jgi:hypothetical protein
MTIRTRAARQDCQKVQSAPAKLAGIVTDGNPTRPPPGTENAMRRQSLWTPAPGTVGVLPSGGKDLTRGPLRPSPTPIPLSQQRRREE